MEASWLHHLAGLVPPQALCGSFSEAYSCYSVLHIFAYLFSIWTLESTSTSIYGNKHLGIFIGVAFRSCIKLKAIDLFIMLSSPSLERDFKKLSREFSDFTFIGFSHLLLSLFLNILCFCCFCKWSFPAWSLIAYGFFFFLVCSHYSGCLIECSHCLCLFSSWSPWVFMICHLSNCRFYFPILFSLIVFFSPTALAKTTNVK